VLVAPPPFDGTDIGSCLTSATIFGRDLSVCDIPRAEYEHRDADVIELLRAFSGDYKVVWVSDVLCGTDTCVAALDNAFVYRDNQHYSEEGSREIGRRLDLYGVITEGQRR
jgi:hypothetical protein